MTERTIHNETKTASPPSPKPSWVEPYSHFFIENYSFNFIKEILDQMDVFYTEHRDKHMFSVEFKVDDTEIIDIVINIYNDNNKYCIEVQRRLGDMGKFYIFYHKFKKLIEKNNEETKLNIDVINIPNMYNKNVITEEKNKEYFNFIKNGIKSHHTIMVEQSFVLLMKLNDDQILKIIEEVNLIEYFSDNIDKLNKNALFMLTNVIDRLSSKKKFMDIVAQYRLMDYMNSKIKLQKSPLLKSKMLSIKVA